jgi:RHS repeat-associated protein
VEPPANRSKAIQHDLNPTPHRSSYYRARYYDPRTGRFLNEDPTRYAGGNVNFYPYASNAPTRLIDPVGLATVTNNTGSPILVWGNPGAGHGTSGGNVYGVIPPDGKLHGGDNPITGYATPQEAVDAYNRNGPTPKPAGNLLDVDFYACAERARTLHCRQPSENHR